MDRPRKSSMMPTSDQLTSKELAVELDPGTLPMPYPLRNRMRQSQQYTKKQLASEFTEPPSNRPTKSSRSGGNTEHELRHLSCGEMYKGGSFALAQSLARNYGVKSSMNVPQTGNEYSIHSLPAEVLTMIFSYLNVKELSLSVAPVCKYWYLLAHSPVLWRTLIFKGMSVPLCEVKRLLKKSSLLSTLCLKDRYDAGEIISQICQTNRNIRMLIIHRIGGIKEMPCSWKTLPAKYLQKLLKRCPRITKLVLKYVTIRSQKFYNELGSCLPNLTFLGLSHSHLLNPSHISAVADGCRRLKVLWLSGDCQCGCSLHWEEAFQKLFRNLSGTLTHLQFDASKLSDPAFQDLSRCQELRVLSLHKAVYTSTVAMDSISSLKKLEYLNVHGAKYVCDDLHPYPFESATFNLAYLSLPYCVFVNDKFAEFVGKHCPQLTGISLAFSQQITDKGVLLIVQGCLKLHYLDIYVTNEVKGHCFGMFSRYAPQLHVLLLEMFCSDQKELHIKCLKEYNPQINVVRADRWLTGKKKCCAGLNKPFFLPWRKRVASV